MDRSTSARRRSKSDRSSSSLRAAPLSSPSPRFSGTPGRHEARRTRSGIPKAQRGTSATPRSFVPAPEVRSPGPQAAPGRSRHTLPRDRRPAGATRRQLLTRVPSPRHAGQASRPLCPGYLRCPPGSPRCRRSCGAAAAPAPLGAAAGRAAENAERSRAQPPPERCGQEYTDWIQRGSGRGRRGSRASERTCRYKMLFTIKSRRC